MHFLFQNIYSSRSWSAPKNERKVVSNNRRLRNKSGFYICPSNKNARCLRRIHIARVRDADSRGCFINRTYCCKNIAGMCGEDTSYNNDDVLCVVKNRDQLSNQIRACVEKKRVIKLQYYMLQKNKYKHKYEHLHINISFDISRLQRILNKILMVKRLFFPVRQIILLWIFFKILVVHFPKLPGKFNHVCLKHLVWFSNIKSWLYVDIFARMTTHSPWREYGYCIQIHRWVLNAPSTQTFE